MQTGTPTNRIETASAVNGPGLKRVLGLAGLILYGIVLVQPTAPMPLFGAAAEKANGHVVTTILIGMVAMLFTAISYGRMANAYPSAGSAYTYVGREVHPAAGYFVGWGMMFDYVMNPIICTSGYVHPRTRVPSNNIILVGALTLIGAFTLTYPLGAELLNFGALVAFMGVNIACFVHYFLRGEHRNIWNFLPPLLGFTVCLYLWLSLGEKAKWAGFAWLTAGVLYGAWRTRFFRKPLDFQTADNHDEDRGSPT